MILLWECRRQVDGYESSDGEHWTEIPQYGSLEHVYDHEIVISIFPSRHFPIPKDSFQTTAPFCFSFSHAFVAPDQHCHFAPNLIRLLSFFSLVTCQASRRGFLAKTLP